MARLPSPFRKSSRELLTAGERRERARKRRRLIIAALLLVTAAAVVVFAARPVRSAIKGWQARRHATKAFAFIDQEKWQDAKDEAIAAYQLRSTEPEALRAVARFLSRTGQPQALEFWDQLAKEAQLTRDDLRDEAKSALIAGETKRAANAISELTRQSTPRVADWLLASQLHLQEGAFAQALDSLGKAIADPAATPREQLQATILQLQASRLGDKEADQKTQHEAWKRLQELAQRDDGVGLDSLVLLAQRRLSAPAGVEPGVSPAEGDSGNNSPARSEVRNPPSAMPAADLIHRLQTHPLAKTAQKLLAVDLQIQANPEQKESLIAHAADEWKNSEADSLATLARWLNSKGAFQLQLETIPLERAAQDRDLFLQHLDALGALGRWDAIDQLLDADRFPLDPVIQHMYLARGNAQLGQPAAARNEWERAMEATNGDTGKLMMLGDYAEKNGAIETAELAYRQACIAVPKLRAAWQGRLRLAQAARDTRRIHDALAQMLELWPNDTAAQNDEAYTRLLLLPNDPGNPELVAIENLARGLIEREPASLPHRTLLALALLRQQRAAAAWQVYDGIQIAPNAVTPSALAVHAAIVAANGNRDAAREEIKNVPVDALLPEEKAGTDDLRE